VYSCFRGDTDVRLGCTLTPSANFTGTIVVSSLFTLSVTFFIGISKKTTNRTSTVRAVTPYLDVASLNGVKHRMAPRLMPKVVVCLQ
jgi:hypothetical protein